MDGHECADVHVVASFRRSSVNCTHLPPPPCSDERAAIPPPDAETRETLVPVFHDESIFNTNEGQTWMWANEDPPILQPKTKGSGIMVSDFSDEHSGYLKLSDEEHSVAKRGDPNFQKRPELSLNMEPIGRAIGIRTKFMANIETAARIAEFNYPTDQYTIVWHFDQSSCHKAYVCTFPQTICGKVAM